MKLITKTTLLGNMMTTISQFASKPRQLRALCSSLSASCLAISLLQPVYASEGMHTTGYEYEPATGLIAKEIIEPNDPNLCLVKEYLYDDFGNRKQTITRNCNGSTGEASAPSGDAVIVARTESVSFTYNADGSATSLATNALGHSETKQFEATFGNVISLTGPNNLSTAWQYDTFGRKQLETRADNTTTSWSYNIQTGVYAAQPNIAYFVATTVSGQANASYEYYDMLNRKVLTRVRNFDNTDWIDESNIVYNNLGQVFKSYLPYESGNYASAKISTTYFDLTGRMKSVIAADLSVTRIDYSGLTTVETNDLSQTKTKVRDLIGQVVSIMDNQNKTVSYSYDPFGNLTTTIDSKGNTITIAYDGRGNKLGMSDPDTGVLRYANNVLGELIRQTDAKGQIVTMQYDKLGRMTSRTEPDLNSSWVYDTAPRGVGKPATATSDNGYSRTYTYDSLGRLSSTATVIDKPASPYFTSTGYDSYGRVDTQTYPTGFATKNIYTADGYLSKVVNANATSTVYWTANTMDAMGHLTQQTYGNGVVTTQVYDPATGRILQQLAGAGNAVQNMSYQYDSLGNLQTRTDAASNLTETFSYDTLNRVRTATATSGSINTATTYNYDELGNITNKSDAGSYTYNASGPASIRPHAVVSITGSVNGVVNPGYAYDSNGNMISGAGRSTIWTSFDMPSQITSGNKTTAFWYSPEHERTKELQTDGSIVIALSPRYDTGLHFEKRYLATSGVLNGAIEYEHSLYAGGIMFGKYVTSIDANSVTTSSSVEYYSKDHLDSIVAITNAAGTVIQRLSYDVWGKRRYPNGAGDPNGLLNNSDMYHGYTGHEMLDDVGLIHMNGRIFDPVIGRFLSPDLIIQDPHNLQSFNRYTYVWNNPLGMVDPSGYCSDSEGEGGCASQPDATPPSTAPICANCILPGSNPIDSAGTSVSAEGNMVTVSAFRYGDPFVTTISGASLSGSSLGDYFGSGSSMGNEYGSGGGSTISTGLTSMLNWSNSINSAQQSMAEMAVQHPAFEYVFLAGIAASEAFVPSSILEVNPFGKLVGKGSKLISGTGAYRAVLGHHVHSKKAFEGVAGYDLKEAYSVSVDTLSSYGVRHADVTAAQQKLFRALDVSGAPNTLSQHSRIAYQSLVEAGMPADVAKQLVIESQSKLIRAGIVEPARIPWGAR